MDVKRVEGQARETDGIIRPILSGLSPEERRAYLVDFQATCEAKMQKLEESIQEAEIRARKAATEYVARAAIFKNPVLAELAEEAGRAQAQVRAYQHDLNDMFSLVLFCKEELRLQISRTSRN